MSGILLSEHCHVYVTKVGNRNGMPMIFCKMDSSKIKNGLNYCPKKRNRYQFDYGCIERVIGGVSNGSKVT